jgi:hypothetical protein
MADLRSLQKRIQSADYEIKVFESLLDADEFKAMRRRLDRLIQTGRFPDPGAGRNVPWPPV